MINTKEPLGTQKQVQEMLGLISSNAKYFDFHKVMFDIFEGELLPYVDEFLRKELSPQSYLQAKTRVPPINILQRLVDKRSKIYQQHPVRIVQDGTDSDKELLDWYVEQMKANDALNNANELFNLSNSTLIQPFVSGGVPCLRAVPNNAFYVYSDNRIDPMKPTLVITCHEYQGDKLYYAYTDEQILIFDKDGKVRMDQMAMLNNPSGINPYGKIPFIYVNRSKNLLIPKCDVDSLQMSILFPALMTDLNYAVKFQSFSIVYVLDADDKNLVASPNSVWMFKSDPNSDKKPEIGQIKPQVDISETINLIKTQFALWLSTKGLKPGSVGEVDAGNVASGLSKMIDEMDTSEDRQKQATKFSQAEKDLWDLVLNHMHPIWSQMGMIENQAVFTPSASVVTTFAEQLPLMSRGQIVRDLKDEVAAGFLPRKDAVKRLNPELNESQVDELLERIEAERSIETEGSEDESIEETGTGKETGPGEKEANAEEEVI